MKKTYFVSETEEIAREIMGKLEPSNIGATVLGLRGDLGTGKTTLTKSLANILGIEEIVVSPTFVIAKFYQIKNSDFQNKFKKLVHIDAYRIENVSELDKIGWQDIVNDKENFLIVEWPANIQNYLPEDTKYFEIEHQGDARTIIKI